MNDEHRFAAVVLVVVLTAAVLCLSCKSEDNGPPPPISGLQYTNGDTVITIPESAMAFAQAHFSRDAQLLREYQIALTQGWSLPLNSWKLSGFDTRQSYMISPFDNDVTTPVDSVFYWEIGAFLAQFGFGWEDTFNSANFNPDSAYTAYLWNDPQAHPWFDGQSDFYQQYRGMWLVRVPG